MPRALVVVTSDESPPQVVKRWLFCVVHRHSARTAKLSQAKASPAAGIARCLQAVALGAAVQAGIYQGQVADLMVMDVWQASLMRALAQHMEQQRQAQQGGGLGQPGHSAGGGRLADFGDGDGEEGGSEAEEEDWGPEGELE